MISLAKISAFDQRLAQLLLPWRQRRWLRLPAKLISFLFAGPTCAVLYILSFLSFAGLRDLLQAILLAELIQLSVIGFLRSWTRRTRPVEAEKLIYFPRWNRYSFPSLHASRSAMLCLLTGLYFNGSFWLLLALGLACALSRILLQKHFLTDVIFGAGVGLLVGWLAHWLVL